MTGRFLNVIGLFDNAIPFIAIQMTALALGDQITLQFTKVLDVIEPGDDDDEPDAPTVDRKYWVDRASEKSVALAEQCLPILREVRSGVAFKYNLHWVGLTVDGIVHNFVLFMPKKQFLTVQVQIEDRTGWKERLEENGIDVVSIIGRRIRFRVNSQEVTDKRDLLKELFAASYNENLVD